MARYIHDDLRSLGELFADLSRELSTLMRREVQLAKAEVAERVTALAKNTGLLIAGGLFAVVGVQALVAAAIIGLANVVPAWAASLIVAGVLALLGGGIAFMGINAFKKANLAPQQTVDSIKENVQWAKQQVP